MSRRRRALAFAGAAIALRGLGACASVDAGASVDGGAADWQARLRGDTIALLGEVHDNAEHHRLRAAALRRACDAGWRPAIAMEQFDLDRQPDLDRARRERPRDVGHLIAQAAPEKSGWNWPGYEPLIALALERGLPLLAANLPRGDASRIVRGGLAAVFDAQRLHELGLADPLDPRLLDAQRRAVEASHCGALPAAMLSGMASAQVARDAAMARVLRLHGAEGAVLLAGNGHVRRDIGVPRWLADLTRRLLAVGFIESDDLASAAEFDAVVVAAPAVRDDPCEAFIRR